MGLFKSVKRPKNRALAFLKKKEVEPVVCCLWIPACTSWLPTLWTLVVPGQLSHSQKPMFCNKSLNTYLHLILFLCLNPTDWCQLCLSSLSLLVSKKLYTSQSPYLSQLQPSYFPPVFLTLPHFLWLCRSHLHIRYSSGLELLSIPLTSFMSHLVSPALCL